MVTKELVIEGIRAPPANVVFSNATAVTTCPPLQVMLCSGLAAFPIIVPSLS